MKKTIVRPDHPPIVQLFCFIYTELKKELNELDMVSSLASELANEFKESYLNLESSLFEQDTFQDTVIHLKDILEESLTHTPFKDEDFWHFYEAVEAFLYGENDFEDTNDIYWGISNFYDVWEDLCQFYILNKFHPFKNKILYADVKGNLLDFMGLTPASFQLTLDVGKQPHTIRPDLVYYEFKQSSARKNLEQILEIKPFDNDKYVDIRLKDEKFIETYYLFWKEILPPNRFDKNRIKYPEHSDRIRHGILDIAKQKAQSQLNESETDTSKLTLKVIDYKYMSELAFHEYNEYTLNEDGKNKIQSDIKKQLIYEWALQQNFPKVQNFPYHFKEIATQSEFWIPYFSMEDDDFLTQQAVDVRNEKFNTSQIRVVKVNFQTLLNFYITT